VVAEYSWLHRSGDDLVGLRTLTFEDDSSSLRMRFDGWEFGPGDFIDVMVWAGGPSPWQALFVGSFLSVNIDLLAGFLFDVSQGWTQDGSMSCSIEPGSSFSARREPQGGATLTFWPGGHRELLTPGEPAPVSVLVSDAVLVEAAEWLCQELSRFEPDTVIARSGWIPEDPSARCGATLVGTRRAYLDAQPQTVEEAVAQLQNRFAEDLANPDMPPDQRRVINYLAERLGQDAG
jgi:hypothetical protein